VASGTASADPPFPGTVTPGELRGISLHNGDPWALGYWEYLPSNYETAPAGTEWPLLVFLAGIGEFDDPSDCPNDADTCTVSDCAGNGLCRNLTWGPQRYMRMDQWDDTSRNFLFVSPQNNAPTFSQQEFDMDELATFFQYIIDNYPVDTRRMYLMGMSQGGRAVLQYIQLHPRQFAAVAPMPGGAVDQDVSCYFEDTAFWAFHGEDDSNGALGTGVFNPCWMATRVDMYRHPENYTQFQACADRAMGPLAEGRMTMFYDTGHSSWTPATDPIGEGFSRGSWTTPVACNATFSYYEYAAVNDADGVYTWFATLDRPRITVDDVMAAHDVGTALIPATVEDDDGVQWAWTQVSGPAATLMNADTDTLSVVMPTPDTTYGFEVMVLDDDNQWDVAQASLTVGPVPVAGSTGGSTGAATAGSTGGDGTTGGASDSSTSGGTSDSGSASGSSGASASGGSDSGSSSVTGSSDSASASGTTAGSASGTDTAGATDSDSGGDSDGGGGSSGCQVGSGGTDTPAWALMLLAVGAIRRRRRS
jgi:MYXO-CTERM domain-containing protein